MSRRLAAVAAFATIAAMLSATAVAPVAARPVVPADVAAQVGGATGGLVLLDRTMLATDVFELQLRLPGLLDDTDVLSVAVHERLPDRRAFLGATTRENAGAVLVRTDQLIGDLQIPFSGDHTIRLLIGEGGLQLPDTGVFPVTVDIESADGTTLAELLTHLVIAPATSATSTVAVAVAFDVRPENGPAGDIDDDDPAARWIDAIVGHDLPVTVSANGRLLDDSVNDPRIRQLRTRVRSGDVELVATPYVPVDEAALATEGLGDSAAELFEQGIASLEAFGETTATQTLQLTRDWADRQTAAVWRDRGVRHLVVVDDARTFDAPVEAETDSGPIDLVVIPSRFADAEPEQPVLAAHRLLAELATIAITTDRPTSTVLSFSTGSGADATFLTTLFEGLGESRPLIDTDVASAAFATPGIVTTTGRPFTLDLGDDGVIQRLDGDISAYREAERVLAAYRSMIRDEDADLLHDPQAETLLYSLGLGVDGDDRALIAQRVVDRINIELQAIEPPPLGSVNLTSRSATYPFAFQNNADYPMRIEARFITDKALFSEFDDGESLTLLLEPRAVTSREVQVEAIASGSFPLRIELLSPDGGLSLGTVDLTMRSTAPSGIGIIISIGAAAVLVAWWGRELLRSSRRRRAAAA